MQESSSSGSSERMSVGAAFAAVYLIWGSTYLAIRFAIETLPPFFMAGTRFMIAGAMLYGWAKTRGSPMPTRRHWGSAAIIGGFLLLGGNGGVVWAEQWVPSGITALLVATVPLWMVLLDWGRRGGLRPSGRVGSGIVLGFVGVVLLIGPAELGGDGGVDLWGAAILMAASLSWATGSIYSQRAELPASPLLATGMQMLAGGALLLVLSSAFGEWARVDLSHVSSRSFLSLVYLIFFGSIVGFTAYMWLLRVTTAARVATYAYVNPMVAVFLGWALGGEAITIQTLIATAIIVLAVAVITRYRS